MDAGDDVDTAGDDVDAGDDAEDESPDAMSRAHCAGVTCFGSEASSAVNGMTSTSGPIAAATMETDGPSIVWPLPPMQPVTTPPKMAGGGGWGDARLAPPAGVKHSATKAAARVGSG